MTTRESFGSRFGLICAALGMAVGTGNIWRFPRVVAENGGGTFLIPWIIFLFSWSIPLLMAEFALGRAAGRGPVGAFARSFGRGTAWHGGFVAFTAIAIMFYYSVVTGWTMRYLGLAISTGFAGIQPGETLPLFTEFTGTWGAAGCHVLAIGVACGVVTLGVTRGIERACKVLVPALFVLLIVGAVRGLTLEGAANGLDYLTSVDWSLLAAPKVWLEALSQTAWDTGAGWGLVTVYAVYATNRMRAGRECATTGMGNNSASLLAALAIIPAVFALAPLAGQDPRAVVSQSGPGSTGLAFIWIPVLYQQMPWGGHLLTVLFFLGLSMAALTSLIAMVELSARTLMDTGLTRRRAVGITFAVGLLLGLPSAVDLPFLGGLSSLDVLGNQDWVWGVALIVSGGLLGLGVLRYGVARFHHDFIAAPEGSGPGFTASIFKLALTALVPLQSAGLLAWWFWRAWTDTRGDGSKSVGSRLAEWLDPGALYSLGTCLLQWGLLLVVLRLVNARLARAADDRVPPG